MLTQAIILPSTALDQWACMFWIMNFSKLWNFHYCVRDYSWFQNFCGSGMYLLMNSKSGLRLHMVCFLRHSLYISTHEIIRLWLRFTAVLWKLFMLFISLHFFSWSNLNLFNVWLLVQYFFSCISDYSLFFRTFQIVIMAMLRACAMALINSFPIFHASNVMHFIHLLLCLSPNAHLMGAEINFDHLEIGKIKQTLSCTKLFNISWCK